MAITYDKTSFESVKFVLKKEWREWKISHYWVSFPTQIYTFWDTAELRDS